MFISLKVIFIASSVLPPLISVGTFSGTSVAYIGAEVSETTGTPVAYIGTGVYAFFVGTCGGAIVAIFGAWDGAGFCCFLSGHLYAHLWFLALYLTPNVLAGDCLSLLSVKILSVSLVRVEPPRPSPLPPHRVGIHYFVLQ